MRVIGTAGHVDHGKSTLIAALTGTHPDRLKEEQEREMTIELGFGWMTLPDGEEVGIVDVPGHRDFIGNMLAGVGGIDAALLVIAADESVMPQTREHLAILDLLQITRGLVVLTKIDLVEDEEWLGMVEGDIRALLRGTALEAAQIVRVSARSGAGLDKLVSALAGLLKESAPRLDLGRARLPVDRVFSMPGFGTVLTGTLADGRLSIGDEIEILPSGLTGRIRGLQTHKKKEDTAQPGSRTAVNVSGLAVDQIMRGEVLAAPGRYQPTRRMDAALRVVKDISSPLKHGTEVKVFAGTSEVMATVRLLGEESLNPGQEGWVQLELRDPLVLARGDRYILRRPSPGETIGGGRVVDVAPGERHKRFDNGVLSALESLSKGSPAEIFFQAAAALGAASLGDIQARSHLQASAAQQAAQDCLREGSLILLDGDAEHLRAESLLVSVPNWRQLQDSILGAIATHHKNQPLRRGMPREELKSRMKLPARTLNAILKRIELQDGGAWLALPGHAISFSPTQEAARASLLRTFDQARFSPPSIKDCQAMVGEDVFMAMVELGQLVLVSADVVYRPEELKAMTDGVRRMVVANGKVSAGEVRDQFATSRKFALAFLEYLDAIGVTIREGDFRRLR